MSTTKKRLEYVDMVKGIAILWIVLYHLIAPCGVKDTVITHFVDVFLASFFLFSGFFYRPGKRGIGENIKARAKSLMIPFFKYSLSFWLVGSIYLIGTKSETIKEAFCCLRNFLAGCIWNRVIQGWFGWEYYSLGKRYFFLADFWFLITMLFASILFFLIIDAALHSEKTAVLTALILFAVTGVCLKFSIVLPYNLQLVPYWTAYMVLGAFAGQKKLFELPSLSGKMKWGIAISFIAVCVIISLNKVPSTNQFRGSFGDNEILSMLLCIAAAIPGIWGLGLLCALSEEAGVRTKELAFLGSHSLVFYIYHMFLAWIIGIISGFSVMYKEPVAPETIGKSVLLALSILVLCTLICIVQDRRAGAPK